MTSPGLLAPTACRVAMMIAVKNGAITTAIAAMTIGQKVQELGDFVDVDQTFCLKLSHALIFFLNIPQPSYISMMFLRAIFSMFILQTIFFHVYHLKDDIQLSLRQIPKQSC